MTLPIFYDQTGRRGRAVRLAVALAGVAAAALVAWLAMLLSLVRPAPALAFPEDSARPRAINAGVARRPADTRGWLPVRAAGTTDAAPPLMGFYMPWDAASRRSLAAHVDALDWLVPGLATVTGADHRFVYAPDPALRATLATAAHRPVVLPMVQNARGDGAWDGDATADLLADPAARRRLLDRVEAMVTAERGAGVLYDLESLPPRAHPDYRRLLAETRARFAPRGWQVTLAVPLGDSAWDLTAYARVADRLAIMAYDEHWMGGTAGPIASQRWYAGAVRDAVRAAGADKAIVAIGSYAYDWSPQGTEPLSIDAAWRLAARAGTVPRFDPASGNAHFGYRAAGQTHSVWMLDAASAWNQRRAAAALRPAGLALWRLGSEDPHVWDALTRSAARAPDMARLPAPAGIAVAGRGEVMRIDGRAHDGRRAIDTDAQGLIRDERFARLPQPDLVQRTGAHPRLVALTFDDGPDPRWTPQILDVLARERVPATFFVTGQNALGQGALLRRIVAQGSELGNHSATHANLDREPAALVRLELNATQRVVEAYTGRAMRLFRPPFLGDADPGTRAELRAARVAAGLGYLTVGLNVDPLDWVAPGADAIVRRTVEQVTSGSAETPRQIVLLHDSGGDRSQTVAALPRIIQALRARGYRFVTASALAGLPRDAAMPPLHAQHEAQALGTRGLFGGIAWGRDTLALLFALVILLGMARALALTALAWRARHADVPDTGAPHRVPGFVSVLIPAFNEARVIESSVRRILASTGVRIEVIVIDDGSSDGTSDVVRAAFAIDPRVTLLTLENGGKARALNTALGIAKGELVVALDADTQFEPETIARLARWFADPAVGAVAGNAKIGNAVNLVTRWQAVEYVTAQNLERRALAALDAVTVVPGAVGAWRRTALDAVGGYPTDTLAEDQDLTIAIQRAGWRVRCDIDAVAWTEAPETVRALFKQRFRWAYGTLQCLWKHRAAIGARAPGGLGRIGLPQALLFQLALTLVAPLIDVALVAGVAGTALRLATRGWAEAGGDALRVLGFWVAFAAIDCACGWVAFRLDPRETRFPALRLLMQRFGYRQLLYAVVLRALFAAASGPRIGWGKLERSGNVTVAPVAPVPLCATAAAETVPVAAPDRRAA